MMLGHFAVGLAAKRAAPRVSLGMLFLACQLLDVLFPVFILTGLEHLRLVRGFTAANPLDLYDMPWSHSLVMALGWSGALGAVYFGVARAARDAAIVGAVVFSHWVCDWASHVPDMPIAPWSSVRVGLGLWRSLPATIAVECGMFLAGVWLYQKATRPARKRGVYIALAILFVIGVASWFAPMPPSARAVAAAELAIAPFCLHIWWLDRDPSIPRQHT